MRYGRPLILSLLLASSSLLACSKAEIASYEQCVAAGHPQLKTYPGQCVLPDGRRFVQETDSPPADCQDLCGDGQCQEMVCLGSGCPCAETTQSCPKDCKTIPH